MQKTTIMLLMLAVALGISAEETNPYKKFQESLPFEMAEVSAPQIPDREVTLTKYGADKTGQKICTAAFNQALEELASRGGGHLIVPRGVWLTGPIVLRSNIDLHLEKGAVMQFVADEALYPLVTTSFEGLDTRRCQSPISGRDLENISITGEGVIDGNGQYWRPLKKAKVNDGMWKKLTSQPGGVLKRPDYWVPSQSYDLGEQLSSMNVPDKPLSLEEWKSIKRFLRPVMISLVNCKNLLLQGKGKTEKAAKMSRSGFIRLFHTVTGLPPRQYILNLRLNFACSQLVSGKKPVYDIAFDAGFRDSNYFVRLFHKRMGCTPGQYRARHTVMQKF